MQKMQQMDFNHKHNKNHRHSGGGGVGGSVSNTSSSSDLNNSCSSNSDPMQSWWESVSKSRSRIETLLSLLPPSDSLSSLPDSDHPARSLLDSYAAYSAVSSALTGSGDDPLCQWLYDTFQDDNSDLRLVVLSFVPLLSGLYLTRIHGCSTTTPTPSTPSLAGFEAVLLALYSSQTKSRAGKPILVSIPTPSYLAHHPSLYHHPSRSSPPSSGGIGVGLLCPPLEPQVGIKSTKRATIMGVAFHFYYTYISHMPTWSKTDLCRFASQWAGGHCPCSMSLQLNQPQVDNDDYCPLQVNGGGDAHCFTPQQQPKAAGGEIIVSQHTMLAISQQDKDDDGDSDKENSSSSSSTMIPLPWELLQPVLRILGHCLLAPPPLVSEDIKDAAFVAVRRLNARASHDISPKAMLATRSLVQLHSRARAAAKAAALANPSSNASNATTPTSAKKPPEMLLVSK